jgi:hypothetical protein
MVAYAKIKSHNPDKAEFVRNAEGVECLGYIVCGHEKLLIATIVKDIVVTVNPHDGSEKVTWTDIPFPAID